MVTLLKDYEVCKEGDVLTPEQTRILVSLLIICSDINYNGCVSSYFPCGTVALLNFISCNNSIKNQRENGSGVHL